MKAAVKAPGAWVRRCACIAGIALLAACDSKPLDWNTLVAARIKDQVPTAQVQTIDAKTVEARLGSKVMRIDTAELSVLCNRGPKDCDRAFDGVIVELRGPAAEAPKP